jgi:hypothetical protein
VEAPTDPMAAVHEITRRLDELADPVRAEQDKRYLKSDLRHLGVGLPALRGVAVAAAKGLDRERTPALVEELWHEPVHERRMAAVEVLIRNTPLLIAAGLAVAERLIRASRTWAHVDAPAMKVVGGLVTRYPRAGVLHPQGARLGTARTGRVRARMGDLLGTRPRGRGVGRHAPRGRTPPSSPRRSSPNETSSP